MIENYDILTAYFVDNELKTVEVLWKDPNSDKIVSEYIEANNSDATWKYLQTVISYDDVYANTKKRSLELRQSYRDQIKKIAEEDGLLYVPSKGMGDELIDALVYQLTNENENTTQNLFKLKLKLFELDHVKNSEDKDAKKELRLSKSFLEAIVAYSKFI